MPSPYEDMTLEELQQKRQELYQVAEHDLIRGNVHGARDMRAEAQRIEDEIARRQRGDR